MAPRQRDLEVARQILAEWLAAKLPDASNLEISALTIPSAGMSGEQLMLDAMWSEGGERHSQGMVIRVQPTPAYQVFLDANFVEQYRVLEALGQQTDVPVPKVYWFETDTSILGAPFYVMEKVSGQVGQVDLDWMAALSVGELETVCWNGLEAMARIHQVDCQGLGLTFLDQPERGATPIEQQLDYYREYYEWSTEGQPRPVLEAALEWLHTNQPTNEPVSLIWGDARIGNQLFDDDLRCQAVLDWEMCTLGNPAEDLGWWLFFEKTLIPSYGASPRVSDAIPDAEEMIRRYEEYLGRPVEFLHYYEVFAAFRSAVISNKVIALARKWGVQFTEDNRSEDAVAEMLGLDAHGREL